LNRTEERTILLQEPKQEVVFPQRRKTVERGAGDPFFIPSAGQSRLHPFVRWGSFIGVLLVVLGGALFVWPLLTKSGVLSFRSFSGKLADRNNTSPGKTIFDRLAAQNQDFRPLAWGLATANPAISLLVPEREWNALSVAERVDLTRYLEVLIPSVRANPDPYVEEFRTTPVYETFRTKLSNLCDDCWVIEVSPRQEAEDNLWGSVIVQGDSLWEKSHPDNRGMKASEFRARR
jgi:hypothetical protein